MSMNKNLQQALWVVGGGAVGGALSWLFLLTGSGHLGDLTKVEAIFASVALGAGAAFVGVYVIANTDRNDVVHCVAFAVLCGFAWKVVWEGGTAIVAKRQADTQANTNVARTESLTQEVASSTAKGTPKKVADLGAVAADSIHAAAKADDPETTQKAAQAGTNAIDVLAKTNQPEAASGVGHIATAAVLNEQPQVALHAVQALRQGEMTAAKKQALREIESVAHQRGANDVANAARSGGGPMVNGAAGQPAAPPF